MHVPLVLAATLLVATVAADDPLLTLPSSLTESSGVASSSVSDEWFFTHEDSGSESELSAVGLDGRLLATYRLGVQARDWEDMARGPDDAGRSSVFLADIGDNNALRDRGLLVHRVPEPEVDPSRTGVVVDTPPPVSFRLRYDGPPRDAEALLVHPVTGRLYVVTKGLLGDPQVHAAPEQLTADAPNLLEQVAEISPERTGTPGGPGIGGVAGQLVTAGDISPDGGAVALRTYTDLYEWRVEDGDVAGAFDDDPEVTPLPSTFQGEGLAYTRDGTALLTTTEGQQAPVHRVASALSAGRRDTGADGSEGAQTGQEPGPEAGGHAGPAVAGEQDRPLPVLLAAGGVLLVVVLAALSRLRGRGRRPR